MTAIIYIINLLLMEIMFCHSFAVSNNAIVSKLIHTQINTVITVSVE